MTIDAERKREDLLPIDTRVMRLQFADAAELQASLKEMLTQRGRMQVDQRTNALWQGGIAMRYNAYANEITESGSRDAGGDLGFFTEGELTASLAEAAFALEAGEVSEILRLDSAFYILRVEEKEQAEVKELEEVRNEVADAIFNEKMGEQMERFVSQLRERAIIEIQL